ncbi:MAG TPA: SRPBCC domain-containing protein [Ferruginibacter sp.]|nr:SRPBCC domain-containing protein [Ferruginibacter sp.]
MSTNTDVLTPTGQRTITINRTFNLPIDKLWRAWTEPESCKKWWGPEGYTCPDCTMDFREGGKYLNSMMGADGKKIWSGGEFRVIVPQKKIVYTDHFADGNGNRVPPSDYGMGGDWAPELLVSVSFEEVADKTNMTLRHEGLPVEMADECIKGWQSSFDKLEKNLA